MFGLCPPGTRARSVLFVLCEVGAHSLQSLVNRVKAVLNELGTHIEDPRLVTARGFLEPLRRPSSFLYLLTEFLALLHRPFESIVKHLVSIGEQSRERFRIPIRQERLKAVRCRVAFDSLNNAPMTLTPQGDGWAIRILPLGR